MGIIGKGSIFGDDDIILKRNYTNTFRCIKNDSQVYFIRREDFLRIFKSHKEAWKLMYQSAVRKEEIQFDRSVNFVSINREDHAIKTATDLKQKTGASRVSDISAYGENVDIRRTII
jgi:CRP-like cAMP-binding protein